MLLVQYVFSIVLLMVGGRKERGRRGQRGRRREGGRDGIAPSYICIERDELK